MQLFVNFVLYGIYPLNHILIFFSRTRGSCRCWWTRPCWPLSPCSSCFWSSLGWGRTHISQLHCSLPQIEARGFCRRCESRPCSWSCSSPGWGRMPSCRSRWRRWSPSRRSCPASACEASSSSAEPPSPHPPSCARTCDTMDESAGIEFICIQLVGDWQHLVVFFWSLFLFAL